jgi:hypothetical protein
MKEKNKAITENNANDSANEKHIRQLSSKLAGCINEMAANGEKMKAGEAACEK